MAAARTFEPGQRVTVFRSPEPRDGSGGYPHGFVPHVFTGTVAGLLERADQSAAVFRALMDEYPGTAIDELPGVSVQPLPPGLSGESVGISVQASLDIPEAARLVAAHPYYLVDIDGEEDGPSAFRPDELEPSGIG